MPPEDEEEDLSIETGTELGADLGLGTRPDDQPAAESDEETIPDVPMLDSTRENKVLSGVGPAAAPDDSDNIDAFILSVNDQNNSASSDKQLEMLLGLPDEETQKIEPKQMGRGERAGRAISDVLYKAPVKGVRDAIQETINLSLELDQQLAAATKGTPFEFLGRPPGSPPGTKLAKPGDKDTQLPDPGEVESTVGDIEKNIIQFITAFMGPGKALKGIKGLKNIPVLENMARGAAAMFVGFDGQEERLGNLIEQLDPERKGGLLTDVATYLKAEDDDPELLGRLKGAVEDAGGGVLVDGLIRGIRVLRAATKVKEGTGSQTFAEAAQKVQNKDAMAQLEAQNQPVDAIDNMLGSTNDAYVVGPTPAPSTPINAFHGTRSSFDEFDNTHGGKATTNRISGLRPADTVDGQWFTSSTATASRYAEHDFSKGSFINTDFEPTLAAKMSPEEQVNYKSLTDEYQSLQTKMFSEEGEAIRSRATEVAREIEKLASPYAAEGANVRPVVLDLKNPKIVEDNIDLTDEFAESEIDRAAEIEKARKEGHDGVIFKNTLDTGGEGVEDVYFVFDPKQVKSKFAQTLNETMSGQVSASLAPTQYRGTTVHVNFGRIDTPDDLKTAIGELKKTKESSVPSVVEDPLKSAKTPGSENAYNLILRERDNRIRRGQSTPLVAEDQEALKALWVSASDKLSDVISTARAAPTPENLFAFRKMLSTFGVINNELMGIRHETNRATNIWKKSEQVPMRRMKDIEEILERTGGIEDNKKLLDQLGRHIDSSPDAAIAISKMAQASRRYGTTRAIRSFWTLGLLTNWKTHEVNAISNTMMMFITAAERAGAAKYSTVVGDVDGVAPGEAAAMITGMWSSLGDAMRNAGRTFKTGEGGGAFNKIEQPFESNVFEDADTNLKKFVNTSMWYWGGIGRALQASDEFFKTLNMSAEVNALATRQAYTEVQTGRLSQKDMAARITDLRNNTPEEILLKAEDTARYATFTKEPGKITKKFASFINEIPGGRYIIPFINTPSNLFNATIERTPFAPLQKQFRDAVRRGGADQAIAMTKMTMGMSLMSMSMSKTFDGEVTGSGPPFWSPEAARWKAQGKQPYSVKIGDKWVPYNRLDPMGMVLGLGADMAEKLQYMDNFDGDDLDDYQNLLAGATFSLASQITNKSYMQGAANLFDAIENHQTSADSFTNMFAGSLIPSGVGEITRIVDPTQRQAYDFITKWKSRLPGKSDELAPKLDMWGRELKYGTGNTFLDILNPLSITRSNITPIDQEFNLQGWSIPKTVTGFSEEGAKISFKGRPEIQNFMVITQRATKPSEMSDPEDPAVKKLIRKYGDYSMHDLMSMVVTANHPLYRKYAKKSDGKEGGRVAMLKAIYKDYYNAGKNLTLKQFPELQIDIMDNDIRREENQKRISEQRKREAAGDTP